MVTLKSIEQRFLSRQGELAYKQGQKAQLVRQLEEAKSDIASLENNLKLYTQTQELLLKASSIARSRVQEKLENLVTLALVAVTGLNYKFKVTFSPLSGSWSATFRVVNPQGIELDPISSCGGGIADICSMALRIAVLEMYEPRIEGPILLDENFKFLSREYIHRAVEFLRTLQEKTGRQIILVTHIEELAAGADQVLRVEPSKEGSKVTVQDSNSPQR